MIKKNKNEKTFSFLSPILLLVFRLFGNVIDRNTVSRKAYPTVFPESLPLLKSPKRANPETSESESSRCKNLFWGLICVSCICENYQDELSLLVVSN